MSSHDVIVLIQNLSIMIAIASISVAAYVAMRRIQGWKLTWTYRGRIVPASPKPYRRMK